MACQQNSDVCYNKPERDTTSSGACGIRRNTRDCWWTLLVRVLREQSMQSNLYAKGCCVELPMAVAQ